MLREPMVECMYGWGRVLRLYQDYLDLNGNCYALNELVYANPVYRRILGVSSMRLELHFRDEVVVLRGMVALEKVQAIVRYLNSRCVTAPSLPLRLGSGQAPQKESSRFRSGGMPVSSQVFPWGPVVSGCDVSQQQFVDGYMVPLAAQKTQEQLEQRLRSLRAERSRRENGLDVENYARKKARLFERKEKSSAQQGRREQVEAEVVVAEDLEDCMKWSYHMAWRIERGEVYD